MIMRENRTIDKNKPVEVYRNLQNDKLSIRQKGLVIAYSDEIILSDVKFVVQPAGLRAARETGQRNVHAFVKGLIWDLELPMVINLIGVEVTYNPFKYNSFVYKETEEGVWRASAAIINGGRVWAI